MPRSIVRPILKSRRFSATRTSERWPSRQGGRKERDRPGIPPGPLSKRPAALGTAPGLGRMVGGSSQPSDLPGLLSGALRPPGPFEPQGRHLLVQVGALDAEQAGGGGEVPAGPAEDGLQVLALALRPKIAQRQNRPGG